MKTEYKYISFKLIATKPKTTVWQCYNNKSGNRLGVIKWYPGWRQYIFEVTARAIYSIDCLKDIEDFIKELKIDRKRDPMLGDTLNMQKEIDEDNANK